MIVAQDIKDQFGAFYIDGGQSSADLNLQFFKPSETDALFQTIRTKDTQLRRGNVTISPVLQAFQKAFTPMSDIEIKAKKIDLEGVKIDVTAHPDDLIDTWAGFLTGEGIDRTQWPFVRWWLEQNVIPQSKEDWENAIFNAVRGAVVAGTALPIEEGINGIRFLINTEIDNGDCVPFVLGAPPTDPEDFCEYVEEFAKLIDKRYRRFLQPIAMSDSRFELYKEGRRRKYNMHYAQVGDLAKVSDTSLMVVGLASHEGSNKIWTTVTGNAVKGIKRPQNANIFEIEKVDRLVKGYTDWHVGLGFWNGSWVFTNDVDLSDD